jgi:hypothetical protein
MPTVYVTAFVPAATRDAAESAVAPYLLSPNDPGAKTFSVPLVPLAGADDAAPTAYGCCARLDSGGTLAAALPALVAAIPGSAYAVVSPWKSFSNSAHWLGWLAGQNLKPRVEAVTP